MISTWSIRESYLLLVMGNNNNQFEAGTGA